jgi:UDP-GlcNAc:undecaprenyl-phosphate GlcNAc-1-phosphate transferase
MSGTLQFVMFFFGGLVLASIINFLLLRFLKTLGTKNEGSEVLVRWSEQTKPAIGGISFFMVFIVSLAIGLILTLNENSDVYQLLGISLAATAAFLMGLADDAFNTRPLLKFLVQVACGLTLWLSGIQISVSGIEIIDLGLTLFWVVGLMNSINMLDNMDGITTVVSIFIVLFFLLVLAAGAGEGVMLYLFTGLLAALAGFLMFNWHPSRMFMGDSGSQFLGLLLSAGGIMYGWNPPFIEGHVSFSFLMPLLIFLLPLSDTLTVTINRLMHGRSPFVGGRDHTTHHLSYLGMSEQYVAIFFSFLSMINITLACLVTFGIVPVDNLTILLISAYILFVFLALFLITRRNLKRRKFNY